ncbi:4'-phosphopantetheinyl transferase superfamily protein [Acidovorax sp. SUPP2539]|uniref:4'-phosphopantetheinyl transferase family protein n=1 Tax=Acidovorax sp. SUPP2539 TaxID=2920878 RepID=UPI0023DE5C48|nr:4'-phosphopantetheinyl transferase superfamily protein [Acidovorax sp. SUPP2539]GKS88279.1 4'-phosphopantetheinyl transferase superfamily protein [Acidovorax sp. SUPP2539]
MHLEPMPDALPAGIEIFRLDLDLQADAQQALQHLTPEERSRARRYVRRADRVRFAQTRNAVRCLLGQRLGCCPSEVPLSMGPHGKPFVDEAPQCAPVFNVSHSGDHALIALADPCGVMHLGVDIEQQRSDLDADVMLDVVCTAQERDSVRRAPDVLSAFYQRWVGKEAVLKAIGIGVAEHLCSIDISPQADGRLAIASEVPEWNGFQAMALPAPPGYAAALAWRTKESI